jgi:hypothetical protein
MMNRREILGDVGAGFHPERDAAKSNGSGR